MKVKDFFKPDWVKIILTVILFLFLPNFYYNAISCFSLDCPAVGWNLIYAYGLYFLQISSKFFPDLISINNYFRWYVVLIQIIVSYLISCLIIYAYNKVRNNKIINKK